MSGKSKFLKTIRERFGPHPGQFIDDVLYIYGSHAQSKGGQAKATKNTAKLKLRDQLIRAEFGRGIKIANMKRHKVVGALAKKHELSTDRINRILRES